MIGEDMTTGWKLVKTKQKSVQRGEDGRFKQH